MASSLFSISAFSSKELGALVVGMKGMDRKLASQLRKATKGVVGPAWKQAVMVNSRTDLDRKVLGNSATVQVRDTNVTLIAGGKGALVRKAPTLAKAQEFGADREARSTYQATSSRGRSYSLTRRTQRQLPGHAPKGRVVFPAAAKVIPRIAALWVQTSVRTLHEALEGK